MRIFCSWDCHAYSCSTLRWRQSSWTAKANLPMVYITTIVIPKWYPYIILIDQHHENYLMYFWGNMYHSNETLDFSSFILWLMPHSEQFAGFGLCPPKPQMDVGCHSYSPFPRNRRHMFSNMALNVIERPCKLPPLKFNMEPENDGFQKESSFPSAGFSGSMLNFQGGKWTTAS